MKRYIVTAIHNGTRIKRFGSWEFESTSDIEAEREVRDGQGEEKNWPPGTIWRTELKE